MPIRVTRKRPDSYQHGDLREALIQAGLKLLGEGSIETLSLRAAAQLAGVSHAAPYRHFRDKDGLVAAIAERGFRLLTASMRAELARCASTDARPRLLAAGGGYLAFATANPAYLQVIFGGVLGRDHSGPGLVAAGDEAYGTLREIVEQGLAKGELRGGSADQVAVACWALVHGYATLLNNGALRQMPPAGGARDQLVALLTVLGGGIAVEAGAPEVPESG